MLAAQKYGAEVTGYGLVPNQNDGMRMLMESRNFHGKLSLVEQDHRELDTDSSDKPRSLHRKISPGVAVLSGGRRRNLRGRSRDHQLLPHHVHRGGIFRARVHPHPSTA
jgi:hypothetical protein